MTLPASLNLDGFRAAFRDSPDDPTAVAACVDALQEAGTKLGDVVLLFAGQGPEWVSEPWPEQLVGWRVLALWCKLTEPEKFIPRVLDRSERPRFEAVQACVMDWKNMVRESLSRSAPNAIARRDHKRRVLDLFPDVLYEHRLRFPFPDSQNGLRRIMDQANAMLREGGWRVNVGVSCTQDDDRKEIRYEHILAAPHWIPPEPEYGPSPLRGAYQEVRQMNALLDATNTATPPGLRETIPPI